MFSPFERLIAFRYLRSPRQEGFISVIAGFSFLGIALGVATLIIVMAVMNGFREELMGKIIGLNGHMAISGQQGRLENFDQMVEHVKKVDGIKQVIPTVEKQAMLLFRSQASGVMVHGLRSSDLKNRTLISENIKAGTLDDYQETQVESSTPPPIALGRRLAEKMGITLGQRVMLVSPEGSNTALGPLPRQRTFQVIAIFEVGVSDYDKSMIFMPLSAAQAFFKMADTVTNLEVFVYDADHVKKQSTFLTQQLGDKVHIFDWQNANNPLFQAVQVERNVMFVILTLIIVIAAFNIISSLIMLVKDKTRDIAIMRTMGASRLNILRIFFLAGSTLGVVGTLIGVALGVSFALNIETIRQGLQAIIGVELFNAEIYFLTQLPAKIIWAEVLQVVLMSLGLCFLATIYPAWRAARLDPVEALRL